MAVTVSKASGIEAGFRVGLVDSGHTGLDVALGGRALLLHENDASDYGIGVQVTWDPGEQRKGMVASLAKFVSDRIEAAALPCGIMVTPSTPPALGAMWQETHAPRGR